MNTCILQRIEKVFNKNIVSNQIYEAVLFIENTNGDFSYSKGYGNKDIDSPLIMGSITKLLTTTCILLLQEQGRLTFLLFQISGLPDVYEEGKNSYKNRIINEDFFCTFYEIMEKTKKLNSHFKPRTVRKAYYADINFDILGKVIEKITNCTLSEIYKHFIFEPLGLKNTYLPESENDFVPNMYYKDKAIHRPKFIMCSSASGGCITTAREMMIFLKAFWGGDIFNVSIFDVLSGCNKLQASMRPICYGSGYMRIHLNGLISLFWGRCELKGHSSSTGAFAFYCPAKDLFIIGDLNQMKNVALPIRLSMRIAMIL